MEFAVLLACGGIIAAFFIVLAYTIVSILEDEDGDYLD
jgi:hypothetical protein